jgi:hypothetical protein
MVFKNYNVKIKKIKKSRKIMRAPFWAAIRKFGRIVSLYRLK